MFKPLLGSLLSWSVNVDIDVIHGDGDYWVCIGQKWSWEDARMMKIIMMELTDMMKK